MIDFPSNPVTGQAVNAPNGGVYLWDGDKWTNGSGPGPSVYLALTGGTMSGAIVLPGNAVSSLQAVPLQQVNSAAVGGPFLPLSGGTVTGPITVAGSPHFKSSGGYTFADISGNGALYITPLGASGNALSIFSGGAATDAVTLRASGPVQAQPGYGGIGGFSVFTNPTFSGSQWYELFGVGGLLAGTTTSTLPTAVCHMAFTDHVNAAGSAANNINYLLVESAMGGSTFQGYRQAIEGSLVLSTALTVPGQSFVGVVGSASTQVSAGGTGLTRATAAGGFFGGGFYASTSGTAQNIGGVIGIEVNPGIGAGTTCLNLVGVNVIPTTHHQVRGAAHWDIGFGLAEQPGAQPIDIGYCIGDSGGQWPIRSDGSLFRGCVSGYGSGAAALNGILLSEVSFPAFSTGPRGGAFVSNGFAVDGLGAIQCGPAYLTPTGTGATLDLTGSTGTGTPTIAAGGTGYATGDVIYDSYGGVYIVTATAGVVTSVIVRTGANGEVHQPWFPTHTTPANPVATTPWNQAGATGCTLNLTWSTSRTILAIQPSGGTTTVGGLFEVTGTHSSQFGTGAGVVGMFIAPSGGPWAVISGTYNDGPGGNVAIDGSAVQIGYAQNPYIHIYSANAWAANGTTAVSLTAVAPAGAHATVQEWLVVQDTAGTVRYIPCF